MELVRLNERRLERDTERAALLWQYICEAQTELERLFAVLRMIVEGMEPSPLGPIPDQGERRTSP